MATAGARWLAGTAATFVVAGTFAASLTADRGHGPESRLRAFVADALREPTPALGVSAREPLLEPAHDGDAMVYYRFAAARLGPPVSRGDGWCTSLAVANSEAWWTVLEPVAAALRMGALARTCSGEWSSPSDFWDARRLRSVLRFAWKRAVARGEWGSVVETWLTEQAHQLDTADPYHVQSSFLGDWTQARFGALDAGSACVLAAGLARLDARWPRVAPARRWLAQVARNQLDTVYEPSARARLGAWRTGFDPRRRAFDALCRLRDGLSALADVDVAWPARTAQWDAFLAPADDAVSAWCTSTWRDVELRWRRDLAGLRLVRLALAFRFGEALPELADPFADAPLQVRIDGDVATFRSAAEGEVLELRVQRR